MNIDKYYQEDRYRKEYLFLRKEIYRERVKEFLVMLSGSSPKKLLDVGCGDGGLGLLLGRALGSKVYGVDIAQKGVLLAKKKGVAAKVGDVQRRIPFDSGQFDVIVANEIIEHLYDPDTFLKEVSRVLAKNGLLIIGTPNLAFWFNRILFFFGLYPLYLEASVTNRHVGIGFLRKYAAIQPVGHVRVFTLLALQDMLNLWGFEVVAVRGKSVPFETSNKLVSVIYRMIDYLFSFLPGLASDLVVLAKKK